MDIIESFSDWTIEIRVCNNESSTIETYHVHRTVLAFGARRSGYFANLFSCGADDCVARVDLSDKAAVYFPDFLDYMYLSEAFMITTCNAVALCFLSQCFMVSSLQEEVDEFIRQDLKITNVGTYISDAIHFKDETTSSRAMEKCVEEVLQLCTGNKLPSAFPSPRFLSAANAEEKAKPLWLFLTRFPNMFVSRVRRTYNSNKRP
jgi:hypothetical protein